jgi:hypothetical protein
MEINFKPQHSNWLQRSISGNLLPFLLNAKTKIYRNFHLNIVRIFHANDETTSIQVVRPFEKKGLIKKNIIKF